MYGVQIDPHYLKKHKNCLNTYQTIPTFRVVTLFHSTLNRKILSSPNTQTRLRPLIRLILLKTLHLPTL